MRLHPMSLRLTLWLFFSLVSLPPLVSAQPTFTATSVSDTNDGVCDSTHCSLREAIGAANAEVGSEPHIHFAIPGDGVHSIAPTAPLPALTHSSVIVDGWTQSGAGCASWPPGLRIEGDGTNAGMSNGLVMAAPNAEVRGLVINGFAEAGVRIENSGSGIFVECNFIETDPTGMLARANGRGVEVAAANYVDRFVFLGGATTNLLLTDRAAPSVRPTLDVMPTDAAILGFTNRWYPAVCATATRVELEPDLSIRLVAPPLFVATKLEAFRDRGEADLFGSRDLEDVIAVIDGRMELPDEVASAPAEVRRHLVTSLGELRALPRFRDAVQGHLAGDETSAARARIVLARIDAICRLAERG